MESDDKTVLVETGQGNKDFASLRQRGDEPQHGFLLEDLQRNDVRPEDVDIVINTHLHADHCGWNTRLDGETLRPTFPNARYYIQHGEWEQATRPNERTRATYLAENLEPLFEHGRIEFIEGETRVTSDLTVVETPGHTADHASVVIRHGGESALYLGDIVQHAVQLERVAWISAFDVLPLVSLETKKTTGAGCRGRKPTAVLRPQPLPRRRAVAGGRGENALHAGVAARMSPLQSLTDRGVGAAL